MFLFVFFIYFNFFWLWDFQAPPPQLRSSPERDVENNLVVGADKVSGPWHGYELSCFCFF